MSQSIDDWEAKKAERAPGLRKRERSVTRWRNVQAVLVTLQLVTTVPNTNVTIRAVSATAIAFSVVGIANLSMKLTDLRLALMMVDAPGLEPLGKRLNTVSSEHSFLIHAVGVIIAAAALLLGVVAFIVGRN